MRNRMLVVGGIAALGLLSVSPGAQAPDPPTDVGSGFLDQVGASLDDADYRSRFFRAIDVDDPLCLRSIFNVLEAQTSTADLLGSTLEKRLRLHLLAEIEPDLLAACWADMKCVADEGFVCQLSSRRAGRFKEVSLPVLWVIANKRHPHHLDPQGKSWIRADRRKYHALNAIRWVFNASPDRELTLDRLREMGESGLVTFLEQS